MVRRGGARSEGRGGLIAEEARKTYTLRLTDEDGIVRETEITPEQALDLAAGKPVAFFPRNEQLLVGEDGELVERESAVPDEPDVEDDPRD